MLNVPDRQPVLVGVGAVMQREDDPVASLEPLALMERAARLAGEDSAAPALLEQIQLVSVPKGRWRYRDPGRALATALGAGPVESVVARVGVLQEKLIGNACQRIADGDVDVALVVGGEAGYRLLRARIAGQEITDRQQDSAPDAVWSAPDPIMTPGEIAAGLGDAAPAYYAVIDSAFRAAGAVGLDRHRSELAALYSGFSEIAAQNPQAWRRSPVEAEPIRSASAKNPMIAFPYTKLHTSDWSVDQASALLLCSAGTARRLGVPPDRWVFPLASAVSDHMVNLSEREDLSRAPGAEIAAQAALSAAGLSIDEIDEIDLYSCFPVAVLAHAAALGVDPSRPLTFTGGMRFAGGPFNNYVLHTTAQLAARLRAGGRYGLVSSVSGVLTKHAFSVWGTTCDAPYRFVDVTSEVDRVTARKKVLDTYTGGGIIAGYTVHYEGDRPTRAVAVIDTDSGDRIVASADDPALLVTVTGAEACGRRVIVDDGAFVLQDGS